MLKYILTFLLLLPAQVWGGVFVGFGQSGSGGSVGGWTHIATRNSDTSNNASGTTLDTTTAFDLNAGDVLVAAMRWETADATCSFGATTGDANTFAGNVVTASNGNTKICVGYNLNVTNNDTATIRGTLSSANTYRRLVVMQFRPTNTGVAQSGGTPVTGTGTSTSPSSGAYTSTGTNPLIIGIGGSFSGTWSAPQLGGTTPGGGGAVGAGSVMGYAWRIGDSTADPFSATNSTSAAWVATVLELK